MSSAPAVPSRAGLIVGAVLVALHGRRQECILAARHRNIEDWTQFADYAQVDQAIRAVRAGEVFHTRDQTLLGLMAHTQQLLRVGYEEWETLVPVRPQVTEPAKA